MSQYTPHEPDQSGQFGDPAGYPGYSQQPGQPDPYQQNVQPGGYQQPVGYSQPGGHPSAGPYPQPYAVAPEHPQGTLVLILGVLSIVVSPLGFAAWYIGKKAEDEIEATGGYYSNTGNIKAGKILGMVFSILTIVGVAFMIVYFVIMIIMFGAMFAAFPDQP